MSAHCPFCAIVDGDEIASRIYEDDDTIAFMNLRQVNRGHVLVVPKTHVPTMDKRTLDLGTALGRTVVRMSQTIQQCFQPEGISIWQSNGEAAGQEVFHVHVHILPRRPGDGCLDIYPTRPPTESRDTLDELADRRRFTRACM